MYRNNEFYIGACIEKKMYDEFFSGTYKVRLHDIAMYFDKAEIEQREKLSFSYMRRHLAFSYVQETAHKLELKRVSLLIVKEDYDKTMSIQ